MGDRGRPKRNQQRVLARSLPGAGVFHKACRGKVPHTSRKVAAGQIRALLKRNGEDERDHPMSPYKCRACGKWHIGHDRFQKKPQGIGQHGGETAAGATPELPAEDAADHGPV
jgi:hypothetical protein